MPIITSLIKDQGAGKSSYFDQANKGKGYGTVEIAVYRNLDYKKMSLQKLRTIVSEKGLSSESSKLKKNELLKLLVPE